MKGSREHLHPSEIPDFPTGTAAAHADHIDRSVLERIRNTRARMLHEIEQDIAADLLAAIRSKIAYEEHALALLLETAAKIDDAARKRHGVLRSEYFIRRPLPPNHF